MFLIGETTETVVNGKVSLPREYHLKRYTIYGKWKGKKNYIYQILKVFDL